ncbi:MAG: N-acyl homoserine lactonase family protein [Planctomycetota bacterium]|jgi:glyoxylase-like metal-dependent hydrolase (beta-lactamase superfamily II)|nr:N-acyl homoserine lactonase family protein [Planctomycetota bacterium]
MSNTRFALLDVGLWDVPRNEIIAAETPEIHAENRRHTIHGFCVLAQNPALGNILFDTGISAEWETTWPEQFKKDYTFHTLESLTGQLQRVGLTPADIDTLIVSHLHYDHAGNIKLFRNTKAGQKIIISDAEAREAFVKVSMSSTGVSGAYFRDEFVMNGIGYQTIDEDTWLSEDLMLFIQKGHTPGVIGLLIKTGRNGNVIITSDAVYSTYNFGPPVVLPGLCVDPVSYKENAARLLKMKEEFQARIIFSHDVENRNLWKFAPCFYE